jgi:hypothetical protein
MKQAGDNMLKAANAMKDIFPTDTGGVGGPTASNRWADLLKRTGQLAGAGYGGYSAGYGIGATTGSGVLGAVGGAFAGAKLGAALGGPVGAAVGGLAGFVGGILGAGDAAKEAAARLEEARRVFKNTWDGIIADINGDELAKAILGADDRFQQLQQQFLQTLTISDILNGKLKTGLEDINKLQAEYVARLREEAAAKARSQIEGFRERELRAQGKTAEADALGRQEERQKLIDSFGKEIDATERQVLAALDAAQAAEKNTAAVNALTTSMRNAPSGFKVEPYIYDYQKAAKRPDPWQVPVNPFVPPVSPLSPPSLSRSAVTLSSARPMVVTFGPGAIVVSESKTPQLTAEAVARMVASRLDMTKETTLGPNATRADALEVMPS